MKLINIYLILILFFFNISCSKNIVKDPIIKKKSLEAQVHEAYKEGMDSLESGDVLFAAKNLMKLKFYFLNLRWHQKRL